MYPYLKPLVGLYIGVYVGLIYTHYLRTLFIQESLDLLKRSVCSIRFSLSKRLNASILVNILHSFAHINGKNPRVGPEPSFPRKSLQKPLIITCFCRVKGESARTIYTRF